jgi:hypothetical protein
MSPMNHICRFTSLMDLLAKYVLGIFEVLVACVKIIKGWLHTLIVTAGFEPPPLTFA